MEIQNRSFKVQNLPQSLILYFGHSLISQIPNSQRLQYHRQLEPFQQPLLAVKCGFFSLFFDILFISND